MNKNTKLCILGTGNIGSAIAKGLHDSGSFDPSNIILTRRNLHPLEVFEKKGFIVKSDNCEAVRQSEIIIVAVEPQQLDSILEEIRDQLDPEKHVIISIVTGASIRQILNVIGKGLPIVRAMPNTAIAIRESMTCLAVNGGHQDALRVAEDVFATVGETMEIEESQMSAATALGACGVAFFLRVIRAASQGGIEIGFHSDKSLKIAAQTAKGAASLLLQTKNHPEFEIDRVTTPRGVTISGLNQMEHEGLSSAMIKGIVTSAEKAARLYTSDED